MVATHARYRMRKKPEVEVEAREWSWGAEEEPMLGVVPSRHARAGSRPYMETAVTRATLYMYAMWLRPLLLPHNHRIL